MRMNINVHSSSTYVWVSFGSDTAAHCDSLQHTATHCNTLQHTAMHCNTLQLTATPCNTLKRTAHLCAWIYLLIHLKNYYALHLRDPHTRFFFVFFGPSYVCQSRHVGVRDRKLERGGEREGERERERGREKKKDRVKEICASTPTLQQDKATHCNTLEYTAARCSTLQQTATCCNALQRTLTQCNMLQQAATILQRSATHRNTCIYV